MARILRADGSLVEDEWLRIEADSGADSLPEGQLLLPLALCLEHPGALRSRPGARGVWLASGDDPETLLPFLGELQVIAIDFPQFTDGRGYSSARILRERLGWTGELRAIGDVLRDQLFLMRRCGFDSFALRPDRDAGAAIGALQDFRHGYQHAYFDPAEPLIERGRASGPD